MTLCFVVCHLLWLFSFWKRCISDKWNCFVSFRFAIQQLIESMNPNLNRMYEQHTNRRIFCMWLVKWNTFDVLHLNSVFVRYSVLSFIRSCFFCFFFVLQLRSQNHANLCSLSLSPYKYIHIYTLFCSFLPVHRAYHFPLLNQNAEIIGHESRISKPQ